MVKLPFNFIILPLIKPQVANQQKIFVSYFGEKFTPQTLDNRNKLKENP